MRKIKNQRVIRNLANKSFRANKTRNYIAILAISLTAMLFTSLFTIGMGTLEQFQQETMRQSGSDAHGSIKNISPAQYEKLKTDPLLKSSMACTLYADKIMNQEFLKRRVEAWYYPKEHYSHSFLEIIDGQAPTRPDEILLDEASLKLLGKEAKSGQQVTLLLQIKQSSDKITPRTFTVSGVTKSFTTFNVGMAIVSKEYLKAYAKELTYTYPEDYSLTGTIRMDVYFNNTFSLQKKINQVIQNAGYSIEQSSPDYIDSNANWAYVSDGLGADPMTTGALAGGLLLIIVTGYLIIYNVFQISIIRDIRYYGLLKTVGTTGRQIKKTIRRQAFQMALWGIPLGLISGFFLGCLAVPRVVALSSFHGSTSTISANPLIFLSAAVFSLLTIWISTGKPARVAAKVSPVEAVRYTDYGRIQKKSKKTTDGGKIGRMAFSNLGRNKKKTALVILSLSLAVVLLNSIFTLANSFSLDKYLQKFASTDYLIANACYFNYDYRGGPEEIQEQKLSESFVQACENLEGFEAGGRLYGTMTEVGLLKSSWVPPSYLLTDKEGYYGSYWNGQFFRANLIDEQNYAAEFLGMDDFLYSLVDVWKGESDPAAIEKKLKTGKYLLHAVHTDDNGKVYEDDIKHQPGDKITLTYGNGQQKEFEILSLIKENQFTLSNRASMDFGYYTSTDVFLKMASDQYLMSYAFNTKEGAETKTNQFLKDYTTIQEPLMNYESKQTWLDEFYGMINLFLIVGGFLTLVVGCIGILNFTNAILTGIVTRQQELAMLEVIGMSKKQLIRMLVLEGIYYAGLTLAMSFVLGCLFSQTAVKSLTGSLWFMSYQFIIWPMLLVYPALLLLGIVVPWLAYRPHQKKSMIEQLRTSE